MKEKIVKRITIKKRTARQFLGLSGSLTCYLSSPLVNHSRSNTANLVSVQIGSVFKYKLTQISNGRKKRLKQKRNNYGRRSKFTGNKCALNMDKKMNVQNLNTNIQNKNANVQIFILNVRVRIPEYSGIIS